jgi:peptidoglycan hydrolase CwlO-like protein
MDRKKMETLILIVGVLAVGAALTLILALGEEKNSGLYTNIVFAVGFLFYIIYNTLSTAGLQKEIKNLEGQVSGLKVELEEKKAAISSLESKLHSAEEDLKAKTDEATKLELDLESLQSEFDGLKQDIKQPKSKD